MAAKKDTAALGSQEKPVIETSTGASAGNTSPQENKAKAGGPPSGFYIYIGPNIPGLIRNGTIYRGDKASALSKVQKALEKYPLIKTMIVTGDQLPTARLKIKTPGNALHANYVRLVEQVRSASAT